MRLENTLTAADEIADVDADLHYNLGQPMLNKRTAVCFEDYNRQSYNST